VLRVIGPMMHVYWTAYISNVLGTSQTTTANGWVYGPSNYTRSKNIWMSGWNSDAAHQSTVDTNLNGGTGTFLFKNCNYDYVNASVPDCASGYVNSSFPNSLYLPSGGTSAPSFFNAGAVCTYSFPWVTPQSGTVIQMAAGSGCTGYTSLPAQARFAAGTPFVNP
jgi:hypothetical protein